MSGRLSRRLIERGYYNKHEVREVRRLQIMAAGLAVLLVGSACVGANEVWKLFHRPHPAWDTSIPPTPSPSDMPSAQESAMRPHQDLRQTTYPAGMVPGGQESVYDAADAQGASHVYGAEGLGSLSITEVLRAYSNLQLAAADLPRVNRQQ